MRNAKEKSDTGRHHSPWLTSQGAQVALQRCPILPASSRKEELIKMTSGFKAASDSVVIVFCAWRNWGLALKPASAFHIAWPSLL